MILVYSTFPNRQSANKVIKIALTKKAAACANAWQVASTFVWQGNISKEKEWAVLFKTTKPKAARLKEIIISNHPYSAPALLIWPAEVGQSDYEKWLYNCLK